MPGAMSESPLAERLCTRHVRGLLLRWVCSAPVTPSGLLMVRMRRAAAQREAVLAVSKPALERLETERRLFVRGRTLALAQVRSMLSSLNAVTGFSVQQRTRDLWLYQQNTWCAFIVSMWTCLNL